MKNLFLVITASLALVSCSKEKLTAPTPATGETALLARVQHVFESNPADIKDYTYDAQGRILTTEADSWRKTYSYATPGKILMSQFKKPGNSLDQTSVATLDAQGRVARVDYYRLSGELYYSYEYIYDQDGYVRSEKGGGSGSSFVNEYEIVNGNIISVKKYSDGVHTSNAYYSYEGNIPNKMPGSYVSLWPVEGLFGKSNKHMITEYKKMDLSNTIEWHTRYLYELNANGQVTKQKTHYVHQGTNATTTFTYH